NAASTKAAPYPTTTATRSTPASRSWRTSLAKSVSPPIMSSAFGRSPSSTPKRLPTPAARITARSSTPSPAPGILSVRGQRCRTPEGVGERVQEAPEIVPAERPHVRHPENVARRRALPFVDDEATGLQPVVQLRVRDAGRQAHGGDR